jgi:hypothetical protein
MKLIVYRATGNKKPSYLNIKYRYIAISERGGEKITFFPVYGRHNSSDVQKKCREYYNHLITKEKVCKN